MFTRYFHLPHAIIVPIVYIFYCETINDNLKQYASLNKFKHKNNLYFGNTRVLICNKKIKSITLHCARFFWTLIQHIMGSVVMM